MGGAGIRPSGGRVTGRFVRLIPIGSPHVGAYMASDSALSSDSGASPTANDSIAAAAANATAFAHRDALFSAQYLAPWNDSASNAIVSANFAWLADTWQAMRPYASGAAYQNYIDPNLANWQSAYYGANLSRLQSVKSMYDPGNLFRFAQSIPTTHGA